MYAKPILHNVTPDITLENLETMMLNHITYYAFSNMDYLNNNRKLQLLGLIQNDVDVSYFPTYLFSKITKDKYGICMDLNYAFSKFLASQGYTNYLVRTYKPGSQLEKRRIFHLSIIVILDNKKYFVDVGYGDVFTRPLLLNDICQVSDFNPYIKYIYFNKLILKLVDSPVGLETIRDNYNKIASISCRHIPLRTHPFTRIYKLELSQYVDPTFKAKL